MTPEEKLEKIKDLLAEKPFRQYPPAHYAKLKIFQVLRDAKNPKDHIEFCNTDEYVDSCFFLDNLIAAVRDYFAIIGSLK